jgi:hypothetical protein
MPKSPDYSTPTQLLPFGVGANQGTVMLERGWLSYLDMESKAFLLRVAFVLQASKAIPRPGDLPKHANGASQELMGMMLGHDRSTMNRDIQLFCGPDAQIAELFNKWRPGIGCVNRYSVLTRKQDPAPTRETAFTRHDPPALAARYGRELFDPEMKGVSGSGRVALWTFDENLPRPIRCVCRKGQMKFNFTSNCMKCSGKGYTVDTDRKMGANARTVLSVIQLKGIAKWGYLEITSPELGKLCGLSANTIAECLDKWEDLKVLQIVPGRVIYDRAGAVVFRHPQRIIWLPGMLLDHEIAESERQRFAAHLADTRERARLNGWAMAGIHLDRIAALHHELLKRWTLSRHSLGALWNAMRTLIYREGLPSGRRNQHEHDYRDLLFPVHLKE